MQPLGQALRTCFIVYREPVDSRNRLCTHSSEGEGFLRCIEAFTGSFFVGWFGSLEGFTFCVLRQTSGIILCVCVCVCACACVRACVRVCVHVSSKRFPVLGPSAAPFVTLARDDVKSCSHCTFFFFFFLKTCNQYI